MVSLSNQQKCAIEFVLTHLSAGLIAISGPAGSGKTTLIKELVQAIQGMDMQCIVAATTNKAARVLTDKGIEAMTSHQACMKPLFKPPIDRIASLLEQARHKSDGELTLSKEILKQYDEDQLYEAFSRARLAGVCSGLRALGIKDMFSYLLGWSAAEKQPGVLIIDEASMLGESDLKIVMQVFDHVILVGDEYQLPPVKSAPIFWEVPLRFELTEIHRQAKGSQPLELATAIRQGLSVNPKPIVPIDYELAKAGCPVLVWRNVTRQKLTQDIRAKLGFGGRPPQVGENLICRTNQDRELKQRGMVNNSMWTVTESNGFVVTLENAQGQCFEDQKVFIEELQQGDGPDFRFAYALTVHNSQGSEWENVMIHHRDAADCFNFDKKLGRKWLYTGVTRAKQNVSFVA